jgi:hypothetical protein
VNSACTAFRERLIAALEPRRDRASLDVLGWHEHLLACADCRRELAAEEALEILLDSLPEPRLPQELAERVLARLKLRPQRDGLDELLERAALDVDAPALARRVLAGLAAERAEIALDRLLECVPTPEAPADLPERVLANLALARRSRHRAPRRWIATAAAVLLVLGGAWTLRIWLRDHETAEPKPLVATVQSQGPNAQEPRDPTATPPDELLASLSVLESWDLLNSENIDVMLSNLDASDELLLELSSELDAGADSNSTTPTTEEPKNG